MEIHSENITYLDYLKKSCRTATDHIILTGLLREFHNLELEDCQNKEIFVHHEEDNVFEFSNSNEQFKSKENITEHNVSIHEEKKPHKCLICNEFFLSKQNVEEHMTKWENGVLKCWTKRSKKE